jgi:DNA-binding NarL/FixJ family response regulator
MDVFVVDASPLGPQRLAAILAKRPDAVLLSLRLAEGTGFQVLAAVRRHAPEIAFYVLSNFCERRRAGLRPVGQALAPSVGAH